MGKLNHSRNTLGFLHFLFGLGVLQLFCSSLAIAAFTAEVPRQSYEEGEFILLTLTTDRRNQGSPDLSPLQRNFDIINQTQASQITQINGQLNVNISWRIELLPKTTGKLSIPALKLGGERTRPIALTIQKAGAPQLSPPGQSTTSTAPLPELFLTLEADDKTPYVQQEVLLTLTIHHKRPLQSGQLSPLELPNAVITEIKEQTEDYRLIQGQSFSTLTVHYLITPQKSGPMEVGPIRLVAELSQNSGRGSGFRSRFFNRSDRRVAGSDPLILDVLPKPSSYPKNAAWMPAKSLMLSDDWSENSNKATIGEAITRSVNLKVEGQTARILPEFTYPPQSNAKVYADQSHTEEDATKKGTHSQKSFSIAIVPTGPGTISLPEQKVYWWNVTLDRLESLTLPGRSWTVSAAQTSGSPVTPDTTAASVQNRAATNPAANTQPLTDSTNDLLPNNNAQTDPLATTQPRTPAWVKLLLLVLFVFCFGSSMLAWALYRKLKSIQAHPTTQSPDSSPHSTSHTTSQQKNWKQAKKGVIQAIQQQSSGPVIQALIVWAQLHWQDNSISAIGHIIECAENSPLYAPLKALELSHYHPGVKQAPDYQGLLAALNQIKSPAKKTKSANQKQQGLASLHPATMTQT